MTLYYASMTMTHAHSLAPSSAPSPRRSAGVRPMARPVFPLARLARALGLGVVCSALVGAPISYLLVLLITSLRGPEVNLALGGRALLVTAVVVAAPLTVMFTHTPAGLRRRWTPVFLTLELGVALLVGWFAGFVG